MTTYCINLASVGSTTYANYDFDSFCTGPDGKLYGIRSDGLYCLEGDTDNGAEIAASVRPGKQTFGSTLEKRLSAAYAAVASTDALELVVHADEDYSYPARAYSETLDVQRFDTGKGLRFNHLDATLQNTSGCDFTLDSIEFAAQPTSRRI